jgi:hypothetical protein
MKRLPEPLPDPTARDFFAAFVLALFILPAAYVVLVALCIL